MSGTLEFLQKIVNLIDSFSSFIGKKIAWFNLLTVFLVFIVTVFRYAFSYGSIALQEAGMYMHIFIFVLASAWVLKADEHVRVDVLYRRFSQRRKAWVDIFGAVFLLMPTSIFIFWASLDYVIVSWKGLEGSPDAGGLNFYYILKTSILVMFALLLVQGIAEFLRNFIYLATNKTLEENK